ncbi:uncharacterized protein BX664DRAFT_332300 [Halteromyces radiatus]|uniref:uncharacterized protein n=1 Tax=Halteromyces radiatus TaxID=101107 RepID=UPI00221F39E4|nr:uncharacterized protein BX664DRAFT_332300 [Halteromyces radiatus]KAI8089150.1 hypothetical protein BX664DRAFT_332300 [Halteromyces radiatus]
MSGGNIKVVVRCRPLNSREIKRGASILIEMKGDQTVISKPEEARTGKESEDRKAFTFDKSYWSADKNDPSYADQETVYNDLGEDLLNHAFDGYNCCIFAYGQTGAGKSYSMMGYGEDTGIIPRTCMELFNRINRNTDPNLTYGAEVSYIEIYNEKVRDLLNPKNKGNLKVREHPSTGPYVEDLSRLVVTSFDDINHLMDEGNKARTVAATNMNETSSRSHAVFTVFLTQKRRDELTKLETEKVARISLVDLAGSERANSTGATGARLKEGANINRSLTTLGKVIAGLAEQSIADSKKGNKKPKDSFIPYRDSVLTWLLKDSLGGNSKTAMIAAISPADYDETLSTLRYADQAKKIKNKAVINEDPNAKMIRELKEELELLRNRLHVYAPEVVEELAAASVLKLTANNSANSNNEPLMKATQSITDNNQEFEFVDTSGNKKKMTKMEIVDQLQSSEKLLANLNETWEEKLKRTESIQIERERALEELGIAVHKNNVGVYAPKKMPHLVNLNEDPLMSECLMYQLKLGITHVGRNDTIDQQQQQQTDSSQNGNNDGVSTITLGGSNIQDEHCWFDNDNGVVTLHPKNDSLVMVNGMRISEPRRLHSGYRIILGNYHIFRFNHPEEVRRERERASISSPSALHTELHAMENDAMHHERSESPTTTLMSAPGGSELMDWNYARLEAVRNYYSKEGNFNGMKDDELEKLFDDITKIRKSRRSTRCGSLLSFDDFSAQSTATDLETISTALTSTGSGVTTLLGQNEYEEKIMVEKERLQKELNEQKQFYEAKINRMSMQFSFTDNNNNNNDNDNTSADVNGIIISNHQRTLLYKVFRQWKKLQYVSMAEVVLTNAALLKEANIISRELEKEASYQFTVVEDGQFTNPSSFWESTFGLHQFNTDGDTDLMEVSKPCIGVRVLDRKHQVIYIWSLEKLKKRLHQMKNLLNYRDQPVYRTHLNWEDPFYQTPSPKYSFIGSAATSVRNLILQQPYESFVEIICRSTGQVKGMLRVLISPVASRPSSSHFHRHEQPDNNDNFISKEEDYSSDPSSTKDDDNNNNPILPQPQQQSNPPALKVGQQLVFEVRLLELCGLHEAEYTQVHVQFRLSSFGGIPADSTAEKLFATDPVSGFEGSSIIPLDYSQTLSMTVTSSMLQVFGQDMISFEVYGVARPRVLDQYERWDDQREKPRLADLLATNNSSLGSDVDDRLTTINSSATTTTVSPDRLPPMERRSEDELLAMERHDVAAWIQISELLPNGDYMPVQTLSENPLDRGVFNLRQGLQRRITITLSHNSGRQFEWNRISKVTVGKIKLLDAKGRLIDAQSHEDIPIKLLAQQHAVTYNKDGTSQLVAQGAWDSSQHECLFLNRLTAARSRILLQVTWEVETEKCSKPIQFSMEIAIRVTSRDSSAGNGPSAAFRIKKLLGGASSGSKYLSKCSGLFTVHLRPPMTRRVSQLWRLNTASKYVRGEEVYLTSWRPRGVSLINDYKHIQDRIRLKEQVMFTSQVLTLHAARSQTSHGAMTKEKYQLQHASSIKNRNIDNQSDTNNNNNNSNNNKKYEWVKDKDNTQQTLLRKALDLWTCRLGTDKDIYLCQDPPIPGMQELNERQEDYWKGTKLLAEVKQVIQTNNITKKGYLAYQEDPLDDKWIKRWCVVKRPYIYIYAHQNEQDELGVINISSVRVDHNKALEKLLQRHHVFSLYTNNNAYTLQAASKSDMLDWIAKLDQMYSLQQKE